MTVLYFLLLVLATGCFLATAVGPAGQRLNLLAAGLLFWVLVPLIQTMQVLLS